MANTLDWLRLLTENGPVSHRDIVDRIRHGVETGQLMSGERLPAMRPTAKALGVNRDTVALAYDRLRELGLVESEVGRGTFVATIPDMSAPPGDNEQPLAGATQHAASESVALQLSPVVARLHEFERNRPYFQSSDVIPMHSLIPDPALYPVEEFASSVNSVLAEGGTALLGYGGHQGNWATREAITAHFEEQHGLSLEADDIALCQGASQGISLALQLFAQAGDCVAVEEPTYHNVLAVLLALGLRAVPVRMTADGPDLGQLEDVLSRPDVKALYTMPTFHNPLGATMSTGRRKALIDIAARTAKPIIEDAFEIDLRYDGQPVPSLLALDQHGLVVHLFSFSKSLFPGVRVGAISMRAPLRVALMAPLMAMKQATDLSGVPILQAAVADFVHRGQYRAHLDALRKTLRRRRDVLIAGLHKHLPTEAKWTVPEGGYQVWVELPEAIDTRVLLGDAQRLGVAFSPGYQFHCDGRASSAFRLTTALANEEQLKLGTKRLGQVVENRMKELKHRRLEPSVHV